MAALTIVILKENIQPQYGQYKWLIFRSYFMACNLTASAFDVFLKFLFNYFSTYVIKCEQLEVNIYDYMLTFQLLIVNSSNKNFYVNV